MPNYRDDSDSSRAELELHPFWVCPACGRENRALMTSADVERFEAEFGGTFKAVPVPGQAGAPRAAGGSEGLAVSALEFWELHWLAKWSRQFRSHLRLLDALRRLSHLRLG